MNFNPRAPCGARHRGFTLVDYSNLFQSTCPLRGTTLSVLSLACLKVISIHVPLAGHDYLLVTFCAMQAISIHVPLAGHDRSGR